VGVNVPDWALALVAVLVLYGAVMVLSRIWK
jgi:hypothetical protein